MVLLKNDNNTLPFATSDKIAVIGPLGRALQDTPAIQGTGHDMLGPWWGRGDDSKKNTTVFDGINEQSPGATYAEGCQLTRNEAPDDIL